MSGGWTQPDALAAPTDIHSASNRVEQMLLRRTTRHASEASVSVKQLATTKPHPLHSIQALCNIGQVRDDKHSGYLQSSPLCNAPPPQNAAMGGAATRPSCSFRMAWASQLGAPAASNTLWHRWDTGAGAGGRLGMQVPRRLGPRASLQPAAYKRTAAVSRRGTPCWQPTLIASTVRPRPLTYPILNFHPATAAALPAAQAQGRCFRRVAEVGCCHGRAVQWIGST